VTIIEAIHDPQLFRPLFKNLDTWTSWLCILRAIFGLPMDEADLLLCRELTGRQDPPLQQVQECWFAKGRRGGGSFILAVIAAYLGTFRDYRPFLAPGERGIIMILATDRRQARVIMRYLTAIVNTVGLLRAMIVHQDNESIDLDNGVTIEIHTGSYRTIRGYTVVAALLDEVAYWRSEESANPDGEIVAALRPSMCTIPNSLLIGIGSPYRKNGVLFEAWKRHYGHDSDVLAIQASSQQMNPTIPQSVIDRAMEADPVAARSEWFAQFRDDIGSFLDSDAIERSIEVGRLERPPQPGVQYVAFCDPSGGAHDAMTLGIAHRATCRTPRSAQEERDQQQQPVRVSLDVCRGIQPPFDPANVVKEFAALLKSYRCWTVTGDRYSAEWVVSSFRQHGIQYKHSELSKSELYLECLPLFMTNCVELLDVRKLTLELMGLERRTGRSGKDSVDHAPNAHDDFANSCCGALSLVTAHRPTIKMVKLVGF
jgi:hypothetical protein